MGSLTLLKIKSDAALTSVARELVDNFSLTHPLARGSWQRFVTLVVPPVPSNIQIDLGGYRARVTEHRLQLWDRSISVQLVSRERMPEGMWRDVT